jgi:hypothetical protein
MRLSLQVVVAAAVVATPVVGQVAAAALVDYALSQTPQSPPAQHSPLLSAAVAIAETTDQTSLNTSAAMARLPSSVPHPPSVVATAA